MAVKHCPVTMGQTMTVVAWAMCPLHRYVQELSMHLSAAVESTDACFWALHVPRQALWAPLQLQSPVSIHPVLVIKVAIQATTPQCVRSWVRPGSPKPCPKNSDCNSLQFLNK